MIRAIIVDDQISAIESLENSINATSSSNQITIVDKCSSPKQALTAIKKHQPDLVFMDIQMGGYEFNGFDILEHVGEINFDIIFVSGFHEYALRAAQLSCIDFIVKPSTDQKVKEAIQKVVKKREEYINLQTLIETLKKNIHAKNYEEEYISLPTGKYIAFCKSTEIMYIDADLNHCYVHINNEKKIHVNRTMKTFEELLPEELFFRIHQSHLIHKKFMKKLLKKDGGTFVELQDGQIRPVARAKRQEFQEWLKLK